MTRPEFVAARLGRTPGGTRLLFNRLLQRELIGARWTLELHSDPYHSGQVGEAWWLLPEGVALANQLRTTPA